MGHADGRTPVSRLPAAGGPRPALRRGLQRPLAGPCGMAERRLQVRSPRQVDRQEAGAAVQAARDGGEQHSVLGVGGEVLRPGALRGHDMPGGGCNWTAARPSRPWPGPERRPRPGRIPDAAGKPQHPRNESPGRRKRRTRRCGIRPERPDSASNRCQSARSAAAWESPATGPSKTAFTSPAHASRMRCCMNQSVFCVTLMSLCSFMLDKPLRSSFPVRSRTPICAAEPWIFRAPRQS